MGAGLGVSLMGIGLGACLDDGLGAGLCACLNFGVGTGLGAGLLPETLVDSGKTILCGMLSSSSLSEDGSGAKTLNVFEESSPTMPHCKEKET